MASKTIATILTLKDQFTPKIRKAAEGVTRTKQEIKNLTRELKAGQNQINKFGKSINDAFKNSSLNIIKASGAFTALTGGLAFKTGFSEALNLEGYRMQLETATKDTKKAADIMRYSIDLANKTPFEGGELVEGAAKLEAMGLSAKKWLPLIGDMAAATNKPFDQAIEAFIDSQSGELERLKEFGITKAKITEKANQMFKNQQVVNNQGQIVDFEKFNQAMVAIMEERFTGGMEKQANTMKGLWSTVTGVTKSALAEIVGMTADGTIRQGSLLDQAKQKVKQLADTFSQWQNDGTIKKISETIQNTLGTAFTFLGNTIKFVKDNFNWLMPVATGILATFIAFNVISKVVLLFQTLSTIIKGVTAAQSILNFVMSANPIGAIALAIGALIAIGVLLWQNWDTIKDKALQLWEGIKSAFAPLGQFFADIWEGIKSGFRGLINFIISGINLWLKLQLAPLNLLIKAANLIPGVKIPEVSFEIPELPAFATGTQYFTGGLAKINERGGEIVDLPNGSKVIPADKSKNMLNNSGGHTFNIYFNGNVGSEEFFEKAGEHIVGKVKLALANM